MPHLLIGARQKLSATQQHKQKKVLRLTLVVHRQTICFGEVAERLKALPC